MPLDRRTFLAALFAGAIIDPERLLWRPGKLISIPSRVHIPEWRGFPAVLRMCVVPLFSLQELDPGYVAPGPLPEDFMMAALDPWRDCAHQADYLLKP